MTKSFQPMLAAKADVDFIKYPVYVSPKLDGVRAAIPDGKLLSRKLKPIPNRHVRETIEKLNLPPLDGELIVGSPTAKDCFNHTQSAVMTEGGRPDFIFNVFDVISNVPFKERYAALENLLKEPIGPVQLVIHALVHNRDQLDLCENRCVEDGYEGIMLRSVNGPYKFGRSTANEGWLLKLKRFEDDEAEVIGFEERYHNNNRLSRDERGFAKRSSHLAGLVPAGDLGALICRSPQYTDTFKIGTGFSSKDREEIFRNKEKYLHSFAKYKHQPSGAKDKPRFPVFIAWRHPNDMD